MATLVRWCALITLLTLLGSCSAERFRYRTWREYLSQWSRSVYQYKMFPFGYEYGDDYIYEDGGIELSGENLGFRVPFMGMEYNYTFISTNGHISFTPDANQFRYTDWPNPNYPWRDFDPAFIAAYYAQVSMSWKQDDLGRLYWRILDEKRGTDPEKRNIDREMLQSISREVNDAVVGAEYFNGKYAIVSTWYNVTYSGATCREVDKCPRNTFQIVLVTDEVESYVFFNYWNLTWIGTPSGGCDSLTGMPRTDGNALCSAAQVGFNAGNGTSFYPLPLSKTHQVHELDERSGTNITGRFAYKVSDEIIVRGGCTNMTIGSPKLESYPTVGPMLGGVEVNVSGPCFHRPHERIKAKFGDIVVECMRVNMMIASCVAPVMRQRGVVDLSISADSGRSYRFSRPFTVVMQENFKEDSVHLVRYQDWASYKDVRTLSLTWNPRLLSNYTYDKVNIRLFGYRQESPEVDYWEELMEIMLNQWNEGKFTLSPNNYRCIGENCFLYEVGAIQVSLAYDVHAVPKAIWSEVFPLGWHLHESMREYYEYGREVDGYARPSDHYEYEKKMYGQDWERWVDDDHLTDWERYAHDWDWPMRRCHEWREKDKEDSTWLHDILPCPCRIEQVFTDFGRWQPDTECDMNDPHPDMCRYHKGARHCVRQVQPTDDGAGNNCCFNQDGDLMYSSDTDSGSVVQRSNSWGAVPFNTPGKVPMLSHWVNDRIGWYYCCAWSNFSCWNYLDRRTTVDCYTYRPPRNAIAYGDPHFTTFDGLKYTFNGKGEFWLLKVRNDIQDFRLQARLEQPGNYTQMLPQGTVMATLMTSVAMQEGRDGSIVEIRLNRWGSIRKLRVFVNGELKAFDTDADSWQEFRDISIVNNDPHGEKQSANFTVIFKSGVGIQVGWNGGLMNVIAAVPPDFKKMTKGLFGFWDDIRDNDLEAPDGRVVRSYDPWKDMKYIYQNFGMKWAITESDSLFTYASGQTSWNYFDTWYEPHFGDPPFPDNVSFTEYDVQATCHGHKQCMYDYMATGQRRIALATKETQQWFEIYQEMAIRTNSCSLLEVKNGFKTNYNYLHGSKLTVTGCRINYTLYGDTEYECRMDYWYRTYWYPRPDVKCLSVPELRIYRATVAVAVLFPLLIIAVVCIIVACCIRRRRRQEEQAPRAGSQAGSQSAMVSKEEDEKVHNTYTSDMRGSFDSIDKEPYTSNSMEMERRQPPIPVEPINLPVYDEAPQRYRYPEPAPTPPENHHNPYAGYRQPQPMSRGYPLREINKTSHDSFV